MRDDDAGECDRDGVETKLASGKGAANATKQVARKFLLDDSGEGDVAQAVRQAFYH